MKILIAGAGAIGGYFGARLAADGNEVVFMARGAHRAAMEQNGLQVLSGNGDLTIAEPQLYRDPASTGLCDVVLVCVKLWDLETVAREIQPLLAHDTAVVPFQNGVEAPDILAGVLGKPFVLGGVAHIGAAVERPGVIRHSGTLARLTFGELDGSSSWRVEALHAACIGAGIDARAVDDIEVKLWEKFAILVPMAGACALDRCPVGALLADPEREARVRAMMDETIAVGRAGGVALADDLADKLMAAIAGFPAEARPSMLQDLERGRRLELPWLSGAVVRLGRERGVATPVNQAVFDALEPYVLGGDTKS